MKQLKSHISHIYAIHARFQTAPVCGCVVIAHFIKGLVQIVANISFGIEFIPQVRSVYKELHADHETGAADNK